MPIYPPFLPEISTNSTSSDFLCLDKNRGRRISRYVVWLPFFSSFFFERYFRLYSFSDGALRWTLGFLLTFFWHY